ncbi:MAG: DMT family transporter [Chloroflexia bacterium]
METATPGLRGFTIYDIMLLGMIVIWAANPAAIKVALRYMDPLVFNAIRFALATLLPVGLALASKEKLKWARGDGRKFFALGLVGHGFYQALFIIGLSATLAGNAALILSISPAFVAIFGALLGYERVRAHTWVGIAISFTGVALVVLGTSEQLEFGPRLIGDLLIVLVTIIWAFYTVVSQSLLKRYSPVQLNALTMPVGAVFLLIVSAPALAASSPPLTSAPPVAWLILVVSGLLAISASYLIWYKGVQKLGATRTAVYGNLTPVLAALISFFVLGEALGWQFWTGMLLVLLGVSLSRFGGRLLRSRGSE